MAFISSLMIFTWSLRLLYIAYDIWNLPVYLFITAYHIIQKISFSEVERARYSVPDSTDQIYFVNARFFFLSSSCTPPWCFFLQQSFIVRAQPESSLHHIKRAPEHHTQSGYAFAPLRAFWTITLKFGCWSTGARPLLQRYFDVTYRNLRRSVFQR